MITFYVNINQLKHFIYDKDPVRLISETIQEGFVQLTYPTNKVIIKEHPSYYSIELKSLKKSWRSLWNKKKN